MHVSGVRTLSESNENTLGIGERKIPGETFVPAKANSVLDVVGAQEVRWDKGGTVRARDYNFFYGKETKTINWEQNFCTTQNSVSS